MAHLSLCGVSRDKRSLELVDETGQEHTLEITPRLRAALRSETPPVGPLETKMDSALRPRDIQARIRAGESAEAVAEAARTSLDKIMAFAGPVLAEREHVAERAQRSNLRRGSGESGATRSLGEAVEAHLRSLNVDPEGPEGPEWDAWKREDGRWSLVALYSSETRDGTAEFTFDARGNFVVADNEDARWLVGDVIAVVTAPLDDLSSARARRRGARGDDDLPLGDDAIELVSPPAAPAGAPAGAPSEAAAALDEEAPEPASTDPGDVDLELPYESAPLEAYLGDQTERDERSARTRTPSDDEPAATREADEPHADGQHEGEPGPRRTVQKKRGRASVPSWDEIMFGGGDQ